MTRLVCWQPLLTDHQRHTLDALGTMLGAMPDYIVATLGDAARDRQGWARVDSSLIVLPRTGWLRWAWTRLARDADAVHIFGSPFGDRRLIVVLLLALRRCPRVWLVSEPWSDSVESYFSKRPTAGDRAKAWLRPALYRLYGRLIRRRVAGVFAIAPLAARQYRAIGVPATRIVPFGYFVPGPAAIPPPPAAGVLRIVFVGALIPRKGVADLATAAALLAARGAPVAIDVYGPGDFVEAPALRHRGRIAFGDVSRVVANYDVLVVPSRHDGWAVVVNEAIIAGVPVVASDRTGAGAMIDRWGCGARFAAGDPVALADTLAALAGDPARVAAMRAATHALAAELTPERAARYMAAAIAGEPEANPWYD